MTTVMQVRKIIQRPLRGRGGGVDLAADLNAAIAANVGERGQTTHVSSRRTAASDQQRSRKAEANEGRP
jgi:hypothetical protein